MDETPQGVDPNKGYLCLQGEWTGFLRQPLLAVVDEGCQSSIQFSHCTDISSPQPSLRLKGPYPVTVVLIPNPESTDQT